MIRKILKPIVLISSICIAAFYIFLSSESYQKGSNGAVMKIEDSLLIKKKYIFDTIYYKDTFERNSLLKNEELERIRMFSSKSQVSNKIFKIILPQSIKFKLIQKQLDTIGNYKLIATSEMLSAMSSKTSITPFLYNDKNKVVFINLLTKSSKTKLTQKQKDSIRYEYFLKNMSPEQLRAMSSKTMVTPNLIKGYNNEIIQDSIYHLDSSALKNIIQPNLSCSKYIIISKRIIGLIINIITTKFACSNIHS